MKATWKWGAQTLFDSLSGDGAQEHGVQQSGGTLVYFGFTHWILLISDGAGLYDRKPGGGDRRLPGHR